MDSINKTIKTGNIVMHKTKFCVVRDIYKQDITVYDIDSQEEYHCYIGELEPPLTTNYEDIVAVICQERGRRSIQKRDNQERVRF